MNRSWIRRVAPVTAVALLALAACGDDDDADTTTAPTEATTETTEPTDDTDDTETTDDSEATDDTDATAPTESTEGGDTTDGGETAPADEYVAAAADALGFADADISECMARALVDGIGMDRIEASGLSPEEFVDAESLAELDLAVEATDAPDVQAAMADCGDLVEAYLEANDVTGQEAVCARAELTNDLFAEWLVTRLSELPATPEIEAMEAALAACDTD